MKILIATPVLYDKSSAFNHLFKDIIGGFLAAGHQVIRLVACRNDQEADFTYGYAGPNIQHVRFRRAESGHRNILSRYLRDTLTNLRQARALRQHPADVLFEDVSYSSFWMVRAAKKRGMRVVAMLQDVWPDNAVQCGLLKPNGLLYRYFEWWQRQVYRRADKIVCISDDMKEFLVGKGVPAEKVEVIYNWGYRDEVGTIPWDENQFVKKYQLPRDKFYAVYAGNLGKMQNVELIVRAARQLQGDDRIQFLIVGDGARRETIAEQAAGLTNVTMLPLQPPELAEHIYSMAGVNLIPLVEGGAQTAMPSKTAVLLSCARPAIFCFGDQTKFGKLLTECRAGSCVSATDESQLAAAIRRIALGQDEYPGAAQLFQRNFCRTANVERYCQAIQ